MGGGGGSQKTTSTSGYGAFDPQAKQFINYAGQQYYGGDFGQRADFTGLQEAGYDAQLGGIDVADSSSEAAQFGQSQLATLAGGGDIVPLQSAGTDGLKAQALFGAQQQLLGNTQGASATGGVGGGRQRLNEQVLAQGLAAKTAGIDYQDLQARRGQASGAAQNLIGTSRDVTEAGQAGGLIAGDVGRQLQADQQAELDRAYDSAARYAGLFTGVAPKSTEQTTSGGGK